MLSTILGRIGLPFLIEFVSSALGQINHPVAKTATDALEEVENALTRGSISSDQIAEANRHAEAMAQMNIQQYETSLTQINESLRAEILSQDKYVRRMRPTFGYLMAGTWAAQMFGLAYVMIFHTEKAPFILQGMASLSTIWAVGLSVLGIYVYKRSEDKKHYAMPFFSSSLPETNSPKITPDMYMND